MNTMWDNSSCLWHRVRQNCTKLNCKQRRTAQSTEVNTKGGERDKSGHLWGSKLGHLYVEGAAQTGQST
eukprot:1160492-Pelagomonas_calceolata.AAC.4